MSNLKNIAFLALFQLTVFVLPLAVKSVHKHDRNISYLQGITNSEEENCVICSFEYLPYVAPIKTALIFCTLKITAELPLRIEKVFISFNLFYSLRAPPKSISF
jgi:hypothetical protein